MGPDINFPFHTTIEIMNVIAQKSVTALFNLKTFYHRIVFNELCTYRFY